MTVENVSFALYHCDRCGYVHQDHNGAAAKKWACLHFQFKNADAHLRKYSTGARDWNFDICPKCIEDLNNFWNLYEKPTGVSSDQNGDLSISELNSF